MSIDNIEEITTSNVEINGLNNIRQKLNDCGRKKENIFFLINYKMDFAYILELNSLKQSNIACNINGQEYGRELNYKNSNNKQESSRQISAKVLKEPISYSLYKQQFNLAKDRILKGDSYLLNLTFATKLRTQEPQGINLDQIYLQAEAMYKCAVLNKFVFFSPETFIKIEQNKISSFPMKGTIDASLPDAQNKLLSNYKELCEHYTIVDLIRNDLSIVSKNVEVENFRYISRVKTNSRGEILQTSSKVSGRLEENWQNKLGNILMSILPAGSITGAPKKMTQEIIAEAELEERGFYTGIMGVFTGDGLDSCVNIRFVEQRGDNLFVYKSGGGITCNSSVEDEYKELLTKVYVPGTI